MTLVLIVVLAYGALFLASYLSTRHIRQATRAEIERMLADHAAIEATRRDLDALNVAYCHELDDLRRELGLLKDRL